MKWLEDSWIGDGAGKRNHRETCKDKLVFPTPHQIMKGSVAFKPPPQQGLCPPEEFPARRFLMNCSLSLDPSAKISLFCILDNVRNILYSRVSNIRFTVTTKEHSTFTNPNICSI